MKTLRIISLIAIGMIITFIIPNKEKELLKTQNQKLLQQVELFNQSDFLNDYYSNGFSILPKGTKTITFKNFKGYILFYQGADLENKNTRNPEYFSVISDPIHIQEQEKTIEIPNNVVAILQKSFSKGNYEVEIVSEEYY
jgi:hypothetical protein